MGVSVGFKASAYSLLTDPPAVVPSAPPPLRPHPLAHPAAAGYNVRNLLGRKPAAAAVMSSLCLLYALSGFWGRGGTPGGVGAKPAGGDDGPWLKKLQEKLGAMVPGNTLYRLGEPGAPRCPHLDRHQHRPASDAAAALLTPPEAVPVWTPPTGEGLEAMHRARAQRLLAPWRESGLHRSNMVTADHEDHVQCEEPILIKYKAGKLSVFNRAALHPDGTSRLCLPLGCRCAVPRGIWAQSC